MARNLAFLKSPPTEVTVNGELLKFYPLSLNAVHKLKSIGKPVAKALSMVFVDTKADVGKNIKEVTNPVDRITMTETTIDPISPDLAKLREAQRSQGIEEIMSALTDPATMRDVVHVIMDSLRDDFPTRSETEVADFISKTDVPTVVELLQGVVKANAGVFSPLVERLTEQMRKTILPQSEPQPSETIPASESLPRSETKDTSEPAQLKLVKNEG